MRTQTNYRSPQNKYGAVFAAAAAGLFAYLATNGPTGGLVVGSVGAVLLLLFAWRAAVVGIHVVAGGVKVVSFFTTTQIGWDDIHRFTVAPRGPYPYSIHVILRDGRDIECVGTAAGRRPTERARRTTVEEPVAELNTLLAQRQGASSGE